ncbi:MAG: Crp/Fnr family transcriptional regulator [Clostridia bacterium]|nr:Crp/Fnr family transcriptional regulator [Clostridia bacterium]
MKLNFDINDFINDLNHSCHRVQKKTFEKNEVITSYIQKRNQFCILIDGHADLVRYDRDGNRTIVEHLSKNDIFGEVFYTVTTNNELTVEAREKCEVIIYSYDYLRTRCRANCKFHQVLSENLPELILTKVIDLNMRVELLTKRSIREKLLCYFSLLSTQNLNKTFSLPFSLTDLADYLSVDRSAMMREIKQLREEGFIEKNKNKITLKIY